ncbi:hypothetical protein M413DRAFT_57907, partial [Hebeloma cylindrosporum]
PTSRLSDVSLLTDVIASSSKGPLVQFTKPNSQTYLSNLTTFGLQELLSEPTTLQTQSHHLTSSLTSLTHTSYPTFLSLHRTTNALTTSLSSLSSSLDALLTSSLPALEECAAGWKVRTESILKERGKARVVLEQHEKIRDLLEIPLLIDTCVRNGYFAEALSLVSHAKSLASTAASSNKPISLIISSVLSEVHHSIMQMLLSLLSTLYEPNRKLPALWKAVNFLRKMDSTLEPCGGDIVRMTKHGELDEREKEDLARYLKKYVDLWREGVYDVITQYTTIFLEKSASSTALQEWVRLQALITTYASRALTTHLLPLLSSSLSLLSLSLLPSLLTQLTYCSTAFARVGLDFRGILSTLFSDAVAEVVSQEMRKSTVRFTSRFKIPSVSTQSTTHIINGTAKSKWETPSKWLVTTASAALPPVPVTPLTPAAPSLTHSPPHIPPQILASYPPLAEFTNSLLGVLNNLRLLAPTDILPTLAIVLDNEVLGESGEILHAYIKTFCKDPPPAMPNGADAGDDGSEKEKKVIMSFGQVYFGVLVPFVRRALVEGVYGVALDSNFEGGDRLPNVVMDWEDFVLEDQEE